MRCQQQHVLCILSLFTCKCQNMLFEKQPVVNLHACAHRYGHTHAQTHSRAVRRRLHDWVSSNSWHRSSVTGTGYTWLLTVNVKLQSHTRSLSNIRTHTSKWALAEKAQNNSAGTLLCPLNASLSALYYLFLHLVVFVWACPHIGNVLINTTYIKIYIYK